MGATSITDMNKNNTTSTCGMDDHELQVTAAAEHLLLDDGPVTMEPMILHVDNELAVPVAKEKGVSSSAITSKSLHQSQHLSLVHALEPTDDPSKSTRTPVTAASTMSFSDSSSEEEQRYMKISQLAKHVYQKSIITEESSRSGLLDMTDHFPHFNESEIVYGQVLGTGCFGTVYEVRGFDLHEHALRRRSFDFTRSHVADEEVPSGDMESRRFMATHAFRNEGHARYAIKKLSPNMVQEAKQSDLIQAIADLVSEAKILSAIEHPNIIKLRAIKAGDRFRPDFFILLDRLYETLAQRIELWREQIQGTKPTNFFDRILSFRRHRIAKASSFQDRVIQAYHLSSALNYLHRQNLIHRDLKPENIGFDVRGDIKIFDFGMAKEMPPRDPSSSKETFKFTGLCGSPRYMAPEVAHRQKYNEKCDVYSFAILVYEMFSLRSAFGHHHEFETMFATVWGPPYMRPKLLPLRLPEPLHQLIHNGWHYDQYQRPSMQQMEETLYRQYMTFRHGHAASSLSSSLPEPLPHHPRRKSKMIYDKEKHIFRVNSKFILEDGKSWNK